MWCWDTLVEMVVGTGIAEKHRAHQWREEVKRAGIAQERRAARSRYLSTRTSFESCGGSDSSSSPAHSTYATGSGQSQDFDPPYETLFAIPSGSVRPRPIRIAPRQPIFQETRNSTIAASEVTPPHDVISSDTINPQAPSIDQQDGQKTFPSSEDGAQQMRTDQKPNQLPNEFEFVGFGRFRHASTADPKWIKAKLDNELTGPGAFNFFGDNGLEFPHPLEPVSYTHLTLPTKRIV